MLVAGIIFTSTQRYKTLKTLLELKNEPDQL
jgi:hypothetical protein